MNSGFEIKEEEQKIMQAGINAHITKPINTRAMLKAMRFFLREQESAPYPSEIIIDNKTDEPAIPEISGLDTASALSRLDGDRDLYLWILRAFVENQANTALIIEEALSSGDMKQAARHAHTIKGIAGNVGAVKLEKLSAELENAAGPGSPPSNFTEVLKHFTTELDRLVTALKAFLPAVPQAEDCTQQAAVDLTVVAPILGTLLDYISGSDGRAGLNDIWITISGSFRDYRPKTSGRSRLI